MAGVSVALVVIPQSLAYAQLAGVPAYYGLYAAFIPSIVGILFGSSRILSTGPVAMTSLLTAASVGHLAVQGTSQFGAFVTLLALLSGLFQVGLGLARAGLLLNLLSHPVLTGFINAAALIIALSQLPALLGIAAPRTDHFLVDTWDVLSRLELVHEMSLAFGLGAIAMLYGWRRLAPRFPGMLLTVALLTWASGALHFAERGGQVVGEIPAGLPGFSLPLLEWSAVTALLPAAFVIALISFMEAMSSARVIATRTRVRWDGDQELIGQGLAKLAAAFCQSMPVSGSFSRSALNLAANAKTGFSALISAGFVLLTLLWFTPLLHELPKPVLAAIVILAVLGLVDARAIGKAWQASRDDGLAALVTFSATLLFAPHIHIGILTGIIVSLALFIYRSMSPRVAVVGLHADGTLRDAARFGLQPLHAQIGALRFDASLFFANVSLFEDAVLELERDIPDIRFILIAAGGINRIDASGIEVLRQLVERLRENGITLVVSGAKKQVLEVMERTGLSRILGEGNLYATDRMAVEGLIGRVG